MDTEPKELPAVSTVKTAKSDEEARKMLNQGWILIGLAAYHRYEDDSASTWYPMGWPKAAGPHPTIYPD